MCPSVRCSPESLDLSLIASRNRAGDSTAPEARKEEHRDRGSWRAEAIFSDSPGRVRCGCLGRTIRYWLMAPLSQSRIAAARHETVLTFVSIAGTDSLLPMQRWNRIWEYVEEVAMHPRIQYAKVAPGGMTTMLALENYVLHCGLERSLIELVNLSDPPECAKSSQKCATGACIVPAICSSTVEISVITL